MAKHVIVIGAGAAGLTAAVSAARSGANVTVLEAQERPGRKLLVTGNGRCNLTNTSENLPAQYRGTGAALASELFRKFGAEETLRFFHGLGLLTQEKNGCVYPYTAQASSVLEVLLAELRRLKVKLKFSQEITEIIDHGTSGLRENSDAISARKSPGAISSREGSDARYEIVTPTWKYQADAVILACGSKAAPSTGASGKGYQLAQKLDHKILEPRPALVPLTCNVPFLNRVAGVRCRAGVTLLRPRNACAPSAKEPVRPVDRTGGVNAPQWDTDAEYEEVAQDTGELQWTNYGVSGIVIFQMSRYMAAEAEGIRSNADKTVKGYKTDKSCKTDYFLRIDLFPDCGEQEIETLLAGRAAELAKESVTVLLRGLLNEKLIPVVLEHSFHLPKTGSVPKQRVDVPKTCRDLKQSDIIRICRAMKAFYLPVSGTRSFDQAQICTGGVDCLEVTEVLESRLHGGLYFAGEMLDVDGPCGGYNLQWAWTSGYLAGESAAEEKRGGASRAGASVGRGE